MAKDIGGPRFTVYALRDTGRRCVRQTESWELALAAAVAATATHGVEVFDYAAGKSVHVRPRSGKIWFARGYTADTCPESP